MNDAQKPFLETENHSIAPVGRRVDQGPMVTGLQIRMALAALDWSVAKAAENTGVPASTLRRAMATEGIPSMRAPTLNALQRALEAAGLVFLDVDQASPGGGVGVRLRR
jgi:hypothetical protein